MQKKKKITPRKRHLPKLPFLFLWSMPYALGWMSGFLLYEADVIADVSTFSAAVALTIVLGWPVSWVQCRLLNHHTALDVRGWLRRSMVGWALGSLLLMGAANFLRPALGASSETLMIAGQVVSFFVVPALLQWTLLRKQAQNAWLWILGGAVSSAAFALPIASLLSGNILPESTIYAIGGATQGLVTGMVMLWLLMMLRPQQASRLTSASDINLHRLTAKNQTDHADYDEMWSDENDKDANTNYL